MTYNTMIRRTAPPIARVLSLGAGVQSSTLAIMSARGDFEPPDFAVFADTQAEPASVYRWLDELDAIVQASSHPFEILRATQGDLGAEQLRIRTTGPGSKRPNMPYVRTFIPAWVVSPTGSIGILGRKCTRDFKLAPLFRTTRKRLGLYKKRTPEGVWVEQWIGISTDEATRMKPSRESWATTRWPLIELGISRSDCLVYMSKLGLEPPRSACVFCPFHSPAEWLRLQTDEPAEFDRAVRFEQSLQRACALDDSTKGIPYLSKNPTTIDQIDWTALAADKERYQLDLFGNECEGMCGV